MNQRRKLRCWAALGDEVRAVFLLQALNVGDVAQEHSRSGQNGALPCTRFSAFAGQCASSMISSTVAVLVPIRAWTEEKAKPLIERAELAVVNRACTRIV